MHLNFSKVLTAVTIYALWCQHCCHSVLWFTPSLPPGITRVMSATVKYQLKPFLLYATALSESDIHIIHLQNIFFRIWGFSTTNIKGWICTTTTRCSCFFVTTMNFISPSEFVFYDKYLLLKIVYILFHSNCILFTDWKPHWLYTSLPF